ncbi:hypothetical protein [Chitinophaga sp. YIM B06452]|uniref:hypothetical protein n=1 Tax=Chitinophaga sp. YIM B06452 TaxID=3082158 RepID=UPI0031FE5576
MKKKYVNATYHAFSQICMCLPFITVSDVRQNPAAAVRTKKPQKSGVERIYLLVDETINREAGFEHIKRTKDDLTYCSDFG